ncbi:MAG TPA: protein kinase [Actinomycetota bacterium]
MRAHTAGDVLGERYTLKKTEWSTPLGPVWLARDRVLDRAVFVQLLSPELAADEVARKAFLKQAARVAQTTHPGLLQVFDIGEDPSFVVLEHAAGGRLTDRLRSGPMRSADAVRAALGLARGLEALHERGTWHGSLSPSTVLFDDEGRAKILAVGAADVGAVVRSVDPTAEQPDGYRADDLDALPADGDRYALAALTYHMLTGRPPGKEPAPARQVRRDVPGDIDAMLRRALDPQPANRPTLDEFEGGLAPHARFVPRDAPGPRFAGSEFRWLVPVLLILVLGGLATTFGVGFVRDFANRDDAPTTTETATPQTPGSALTVAEVTDFDPPPGNGEEHSEDVGKTIDGDPLTGWRTLNYAERDLAPKDGVGLIFDLGEARDLASITVQSTLPGWKAEIRIADEPGDDEEAFRRITTFTSGSEEEVRLPQGTTTRYVLLWIVELVEDRGGTDLPYRAEVAEVEFFAR